MHRVASLEMTCFGCPTTWEGLTDRGERVYARFRWGYLRVEVNDEVVFGRQLHVETEADSEAHLELMASAGTAPEEIERMRESDRNLREMSGKYGEGHSYRGVLGFAELVAATEGVIDWSALPPDYTDPSADY